MRGAAGQLAWDGMRWPSVLAWHGMGSGMAWELAWHGIALCSEGPGAEGGGGESHVTGRQGDLLHMILQLEGAEGVGSECWRAPV